MPGAVFTRETGEFLVIDHQGRRRLSRRREAKDQINNRISFDDGVGRQRICLNVVEDAAGAISGADELSAPRLIFGGIFGRIAQDVHERGSIAHFDGGLAFSFEGE